MTLATCWTPESRLHGAWHGSPVTPDPKQSTHCARMAPCTTGEPSALQAGIKSHNPLVMQLLSTQEGKMRHGVNELMERLGRDLSSSLPFSR